MERRAQLLRLHNRLFLHCRKCGERGRSLCVLRHNSVIKYQFCKSESVQQPQGGVKKGGDDEEVGRGDEDGWWEKRGRDERREGKVNK